MAALVEDTRQNRSNMPADFTYDLIHEAGLTCDNTDDLPHHVSSEQEVHELLEMVRFLLGQLPKPSLVTIARYVIITEFSHSYYTLMKLNF